MTDTLIIVSAVAFIGWLAAFVTLADARYWRKRAAYYADEARAARRETVSVIVQQIEFSEELARQINHSSVLAARKGRLGRLS